MFLTPLHLDKITLKFYFKNRLPKINHMYLCANVLQWQGSPIKCQNATKSRKKTNRNSLLQEFTAVRFRKVNGLPT